jgi:hypothetical protein
MKRFLHTKLKFWKYDTGKLDSSNCPFPDVDIVALGNSIPLIFSKIYIRITNLNMKREAAIKIESALSPIEARIENTPDLSFLKTCTEESFVKSDCSNGAKKDESSMLSLSRSMNTSYKLH